MKFTKLVIVLAALPLFAASPEGFAVWKSGELKGEEKLLHAKMKPGDKTVNRQLGNFGNHTATVNHRMGDGQMEVHADWNDLFFIQTGDAALLIGGTVVNGKTTAPGEIRGTGATGGEKHPIAAGDVVHIPAGVPHQFLIPAGKQVTYVAVKIPAGK